MSVIVFISISIIKLILILYWLLQFLTDAIRLNIINNMQTDKILEWVTVLKRKFPILIAYNYVIVNSNNY
jgi:hypothetical protein